ncbi:MAG: hypothetical protein AB7Q81_22690 [Gammaproteobacteria bacterium]
MHRSFPLVLACLFAGAVHAQPAAERSPGDLTNEERLEMMSQANGYNTCVYERAVASIDSDPDVRRIADIAMGECDDRLQTLGATITGWGMPEYFADGFTATVRNRAARKLLPELAIRKRQ